MKKLKVKCIIEYEVECCEHLSEENILDLITHKNDESHQITDDIASYKGAGFVADNKELASYSWKPIKIIPLYFS